MLHSYHQNRTWNYNATHLTHREAPQLGIGLSAKNWINSRMGYMALDGGHRELVCCYYLLFLPHSSMSRYWADWVLGMKFINPDYAERSIPTASSALGMKLGSNLVYYLVLAFICQWFGEFTLEPEELPLERAISHCLQY